MTLRLAFAVYPPGVGGSILPSVYTYPWGRLTGSSKTVSKMSAYKPRGRCPLTQQAPASASDADALVDGRYLTYRRRSLENAQPNNDIWVLPLSGDAKPFPIVQTPFDDLYSAVSPDGKWMAYQSNESGSMQVYITAFPGGGAKWQASTNGGEIPRRRRDSKELFFSIRPTPSWP